MTPQSSVLVVAPVILEREAELRSLLASMTGAPGLANPGNSLVPFRQLKQLHYARFVILDDQSLGDISSAYGLPQVDYPLSLAFVADFDGSADAFRTDLVKCAATGLQRIFSCCHGCVPGDNLAQWMKEHEQPSATMYVNWIGRTVRQVHEEDKLRVSLQAYLQRNSVTLADNPPAQIHQALRQFVAEEIAGGRLSLSKPAPTPLVWRVENFLHLVGVPLILLILTPFLIIYSPMFIYQLRKREKHDLEIDPRPKPEHEQALARLEDYDVTNQFTAIGSLKPGLFRLWTVTLLLWLLNYTTRHIYYRGHLSRVSTIHFARWVFLNQKRRLLFASNYDGSLESYRDDFINKVGWGLNLVFSNGVGYPTTNWLVLDGSKGEQKFKYFLRRHQLPTEVWYKAYPGLTAFDLKRNTLIRQGLENTGMSETELRQWMRLF